LVVDRHLRDRAAAPSDQTEASERGDKQRQGGGDWRRSQGRREGELDIPRRKPIGDAVPDVPEVGELDVRIEAEREQEVVGDTNGETVDVCKMPPICTL